MGRLFQIAQLSVIGLCLMASPTAEELEGGIASNASIGTLPQQILIADADPVAPRGPFQRHFSPSELRALTNPVTIDSASFSGGPADISTSLVMLNRPDRHTASQQRIGNSDGLLSDAGGLMETAVTPKLEDTSVNGSPQAGGGYQPPTESYLASTDAESLDWNQVILTAMQVPEPSTYLLFGGFLTVAALIKRHRRPASENAS